VVISITKPGQKSVIMVCMTEPTPRPEEREAQYPIAGDPDEEAFRHDPNVRAVAARIGGSEVALPGKDPEEAVAEIIRLAENTPPPLSGVRRMGAALRRVASWRRNKRDR